MSKTLTISLPDYLEQALNQALEQTHQSAEELILQMLTQKFSASPAIAVIAPDPLFKLAGCITTNLTDVASNHDYYIGQALYEEMNHDAE
jgi:hypothetical protein